MKIGDLPPLKGIPRAGQDKEGGAPANAPAQEGAGLAVGQILKGRVVGFAQDGKVLLEIGGQTIAARSEVPLRLGNEFWLEVRQAGDALWLSLADKKGFSQEFLREFLPNTLGLGKAVDILLGLAGRISQGEKTGGEGGPIFQELASLAQGAEAKPENTARLLSWLAAEQHGPGKALYDGGLSEQLRAALEVLGRNPELLPSSEAGTLQRFVTLLDMQQQLNLLPSAADQPLYWFLPCLFAVGAGWGEWLLVRDQGKEGRGGERPVTLSFFLEMSNLGELQIQLRVRGKGVQGELVVAGTEVLEFFQTNISELEEILAGLGYTPVSLRLRTARTAMLHELKTAFEHAARLKPVRIVDVKA